VSENRLPILVGKSEGQKIRDTDLNGKIILKRILNPCQYYGLLGCDGLFYGAVNISNHTGSNKRRDRAVVIGTGYGMDDKSSRSSSPGRVKNFIFCTSSRPVLGPTQLHFQWVPGALSQGVKRPGCKVDHSSPTSAKVKKMWIYTSTPHTPSWRST
jgi:hypothetical protein